MINRLRQIKQGGIGCIFLAFALVAVLLVGEIRCIVKAVNCNYDPVGEFSLIK